MASVVVSLLLATSVTSAQPLQATPDAWKQKREAYERAIKVVGYDAAGARGQRAPPWPTCFMSWARYTWRRRHHGT